MNKLKLDADSLAVDTFEPVRQEEAARGTVAAHGTLETQKIICSVSTLKTDLTCCPCTPMF